MSYFFNVEDIKKIILEAGKAIMDIYAQDFMVYEKADESPVTDADLASEQIIYNGLKDLYPDIPVVGEEHTANGEEPDLSTPYFWLVDPIDGTADFVKKNGEFTVNIALIENDTPVFGMVYVPVAKELYYTRSIHQAVLEKEGKVIEIHTRKVSNEGYTVLNSRTHCDQTVVQEILSGFKIKEQFPCGSSWKFCKIARGEADLYPCSHHTKEWDTAAAHAVLKAAGGDVYDANTRLPLKYRKEGLKNPIILSSGEIL